MSATTLRDEPLGPISIHYGVAPEAAERMPPVLQAELQPLVALRIGAFAPQGVEANVSLESLAKGAARQLRDILR